MPAGEGLAFLQVGLARIHPRVEVSEALRDGLDALPVHAGVGVEGAGLVVLAGLDGGDELLGLGQQLVGLVLHIARIGGGGLVDELLVVASGAHLFAGVDDAEGGADALAHHAGLAGAEVLPRREAEHQVTRQARPDVLHLADDAQPVTSQHVELVDLAAGVRDAEGHGARGGGGRGHLAGVVGGGDRQVAGVARGGGGVVLGATGQGEGADCQQCGCLADHEGSPTACGVADAVVAGVGVTEVW